MSMRTLAQTLYLDSQFGITQGVPCAGSALENPFVYDAVAKELKDMAARGLVEIVSEQFAQASDERLIDRLSFRRLR
jgi:hypothetical protein